MSEKTEALKVVKKFMKDNGLLYHEILEIAVIDISLLTKKQYEDLLKLIENK